MKKTFLCVALIIGINAVGFSQEILLSGGAAFGNYFMSGADLENNYTGSTGINLNYYSFNEKNMGLFFNYGILFPVTNSIGKGRGTSIQLDFILLGFDIGYNLGKSVKLYGGAGPNFNALFLMDSEGSNISMTDYTIGLGIGADVGLQYSFKNNLTVNIGTVLSWSFAGFRIENVTTKEGEWSRNERNEGWTERYSMIGIRPYITVGYSMDMKNHE